MRYVKKFESVVNIDKDKFKVIIKVKKVESIQSEQIWLIKNLDENVGTGKLISSQVVYLADNIIQHIITTQIL